MRDIDAVLLDLDNTLYHYDPANLAALRATHAALNGEHAVSFDDFVALHDRTRAEVQSLLDGTAASHSRLLFFKQMLRTLAGRERVDLAVDLYRTYWDAFRAAMRAHPSALDLLDRLRERYRIALVSNHTTEPQLNKLVTLDMHDRFHAVVISEEVGAEKPDPAIYRAALDRLGVESPRRAVMVGDHVEGDVVGAKRAGLRTIFARQYTPDVPPPPEADHTIDRLDALADLLLE